MPLRLHPEVATTDTDDGTVLLHMDTGRYFQLNTTGVHVLHQLLADHTPEAIAGDLAARHHIDPARVHADVSSVVEQLYEHRLVEPQ